MKSSIMQFVLFWWQKVSERHPVDNSGTTSQKMSRQTGGIFFRKYLVQMTSSRYKQVLNKRCQFSHVSSFIRYFQVFQSLRQLVSAIRSATTLSISLAVHLDQVFMLEIRGCSSHFQDSCVTLLDRTALITSCHLFDTTLVIKWFPCLHSG